jgi:WD40 repeat protein
MSGPVFVGSVVNRSNWTCDVHLVGHENTVAVAAFSPRLFQDRDDPKGIATVIALGSVDQSVSVWITGQSRPILVARDVFQRQVMDLSWSSDGLTLYACSADGHIAAFVFTTKDLMNLRSDAELRQAKELFGFTEQQKLFKRSTLQQPSSQISHITAPGTAERPTMLVPRKAGGIPQANRPKAPGIPAPANGRVQRLDQQITITDDGKRRIRPTLLTEEGGNDSDFEVVSYNQSVLPQPASSQRGTRREEMDNEDDQDDDVSNSRGVKRTASLSFSQDGDLQATDYPGGSKKIKDVGRTLGSELQRSSAGPVVALRQPTSYSTTDGPTASAALPSVQLLSVYRKEEAHGVIEARNYDGNRE